MGTRCAHSVFVNYSACVPGSSMNGHVVSSRKGKFPTLIANGRLWVVSGIGSMAGRDSLGYRTNKIITSGPESDNVVHYINTFITSSLAFGC